VWKAALAQSRAAAHPGAARRIEASEKKEKKTRSPPKKMAINIRAYSRDWTRAPESETPSFNSITQRQVPPTFSLLLFLFLFFHTSFSF
jgi:hypothetical protein